MFKDFDQIKVHVIYFLLLIFFLIHNVCVFFKE